MPTITLNHDDTILLALKLKFPGTKQSMSELVNDALKACLQEDLEDLKTWERENLKILTVTKIFLGYLRRSR
mgnify:CR=1 FL=1